MSSSMFLLLALYICSAAADLEIAPYTVLKEHQGWEEREFPATKWISTEVFSISVHDSEESRAAFYRLFDYIDGQNSEGMKIPMTAPVSRRIIAGEGPNCESNFTMSFFIPSNLQENAPLPLDSTVYIEERAAFKVAAKRFGGFPTSDIEFAIQAAELYELAFNEGLELTDVPLWTAGFDGPNVITNRRNEVWLEIN
ncbi:heme-binding protein 2 [Eurytemora carolleeae]|uniref:heme-binding protein 2 n=1 Tax=Eurytemora carolleeae TaxID=1294199 RepID=UPI000C75908E|nr:heme-binding protein 2 [Eurytemora carolleeae]|eukprot:XP_023347632.1 heme-binding protein 2-like [Eurytemora affinis]